jgi:ABC-2 type transport system permease protein
MSDAGTPVGGARIIDRGYRSYDGPRSGARGAIRSLVGHSLQRALGLRRTLWAKVLPMGAILASFIPAIVFVGLVALLPKEEAADLIIPTYGDYTGFVIAAIIVFVSIVGPELLCTDRRSGMLGVYLASPLDRDTYLLAKGMAIAAAVSLVCLGPPLLLLIANILQNQGPDGAVDIAATFGRVLLSGAALTLLFTGITMGAASLTDRRFIGIAGLALLFLVTLGFAGTLVGAGLGDGWLAAAPWALAIELAQRVHGERGEVMPGLATAWVVAGWAAWTLGGFLLARSRLHRLQVTR